MSDWEGDREGYVPGRSELEGGAPGLIAREEESPWCSSVAPDEYGESEDEREIQQPYGSEWLVINDPVLRRNLKCAPGKVNGRRTSSEQSYSKSLREEQSKQKLCIRKELTIAHDVNKPAWSSTTRRPVLLCLTPTSAGGGSRGAGWRE